MIHYHGTPITPIAVLQTMHGKHFCVSHARPDDVTRVHKIGQSVMLDNGAFSKFTKGRATDWASYYEWCDRWLAYPNTWAVVPDEWPRVAWGSTAEYWVVGSPSWRSRVDAVFNELAKRHRHMPAIHMLRGMQCCEWGYPFASVDSTDVGQNHASRSRTAREMADKWDAQNGPAGWIERPLQQELIA